MIYFGQLFRITVKVILIILKENLNRFFLHENLKQKVITSVISHLKY